MFNFQSTIIFFIAFGIIYNSCGKILYGEEDRSLECNDGSKIDDSILHPFIQKLMSEEMIPSEMKNWIVFLDIEQRNPHEYFKKNNGWDHTNLTNIGFRKSKHKASYGDVFISKTVNVYVPRLEPNSNELSEFHVFYAEQLLLEAMKRVKIYVKYDTNFDIASKISKSSERLLRMLLTYSHPKIVNVVTAVCGHECIEGSDNPLVLLATCGFIHNHTVLIKCRNLIEEFTEEYFNKSEWLQYEHNYNPQFQIDLPLKLKDEFHLIMEKILKSIGKRMHHHLELAFSKNYFKKSPQDIINKINLFISKIKGAKTFDASKSCNLIYSSLFHLNIFLNVSNTPYVFDTFHSFTLYLNYIGRFVKFHFNTLKYVKFFEPLKKICSTFIADAQYILKPATKIFEPEEDVYDLFGAICSDNILFIIENWMTMSVIKGGIYDNENCEFDTVFVLGKKNFILNENLKLPGKNLVIFAPNWIMKKNQVIDLSGQNGKSEAQNDVEEGHNGGDFWGFGIKFQNPKYLKIVTNGGNGSKGRDSKELIFDKSFLKKNKSDCFASKEQIKELRLEFGATIGGHGGSPGNVTVKIMKSSIDEVQIVREKGKSGPDGKPSIMHIFCNNEKNITVPSIGLVDVNTLGDNIMRMNESEVLKIFQKLIRINSQRLPENVLTFYKDIWMSPLMGQTLDSTLRDFLSISDHSYDSKEYFEITSQILHAQIRNKCVMTKTEKILLDFVLATIQMNTPNYGALVSDMDIEDYLHDASKNIEKNEIEDKFLDKEEKKFLKIIIESYLYINESFLPFLMHTMNLTHVYLERQMEKYMSEDSFGNVKMFQHYLVVNNLLRYFRQIFEHVKISLLDFIGKEELEEDYETNSLEEKESEDLEKELYFFRGVRNDITINEMTAMKEFLRLLKKILNEDLLSENIDTCKDCRDEINKFVQKLQELESYKGMRNDFDCIDCSNIMKQIKKKLLNVIKNDEQSNEQLVKEKRDLSNMIFFRKIQGNVYKDTQFLGKIYEHCPDRKYCSNFQVKGKLIEDERDMLHDCSKENPYGCLSKLYIQKPDKGNQKLFTEDAEPLHRMKRDLDMKKKMVRGFFTLSKIGNANQNNENSHLNKTFYFNLKLLPNWQSSPTFPQIGDSNANNSYDFLWNILMHNRNKISSNPMIYSFEINDRNNMENIKKQYDQLFAVGYDTNQYDEFENQTLSQRKHYLVRTSNYEPTEKSDGVLLQRNGVGSGNATDTPYKLCVLNGKQELGFLDRNLYTTQRETLFENLSSQQSKRTIDISKVKYEDTSEIKYPQQDIKINFKHSNFADGVHEKFVLTCHSVNSNGMNRYPLRNNDIQIHFHREPSLPIKRGIASKHNSDPLPSRKKRTTSHQSLFSNCFNRSCNNLEVSKSRRIQSVKPKNFNLSHYLLDYFPRHQAGIKKIKYSNKSKKNRPKSRNLSEVFFFRPNELPSSTNAKFSSVSSSFHPAKGSRRKKENLFRRRGTVYSDRFDYIYKKFDNYGVDSGRDTIFGIRDLGRILNRGSIHQVPYQSNSFRRVKDNFSYHKIMKYAFNDHEQQKSDDDEVRFQDEVNNVFRRSQNRAVGTEICQNCFKIFEDVIRILKKFYARNNVSCNINEQTTCFEVLNIVRELILPIQDMTEEDIESGKNKRNMPIHLRCPECDDTLNFFIERISAEINRCTRDIDFDYEEFYESSCIRNEAIIYHIRGCDPETFSRSFGEIRENFLKAFSNFISADKEHSSGLDDVKDNFSYLLTNIDLLLQEEANLTITSFNNFAFVTEPLKRFKDLKMEYQRRIMELHDFSEMDLFNLLSAEVSMQNERLGITSKWFIQLRKLLPWMRKVILFLNEIPEFQSISEKLQEAVKLVTEIGHNIKVIEKYRELEHYVKRVQHIENLNNLSSVGLGVLNLKPIFWKTIKTNIFNRAVKASENWMFPLTKSRIALEKRLQNARNNSHQAQLKIISEEIEKHKKSLILHMNTQIYHPDYNHYSFFKWYVRNKPRMMRDIFSGTPVVLVSEILDGGKKNSLMAKEFEVRFVVDEQMDSGAQREIDKILSHSWINLTHSGISYFKFASRIYRRLTEAITFRHSASSNNREKVNTDTSYVLSPYTTWILRMEHNRHGNYSSELLNKINTIELVGTGHYIVNCADIHDVNLYFTPLNDYGRLNEK